MTITYTDDQLIAVSDKLLTHIEGHLKTQLQSGRIQGTDYAQVYIAAIQASMSQAHSFLLGKDIASGQASLLVEQNLQAADLTTISTATVLDRIAVTSNQKQLSDEQLVQTLVQGSIVDQQALQAIKQTSLVTTQDELTIATKQDSIDGIAAQTATAEEQLKVMQERHGINLTPQFT